MGWTATLLLATASLPALACENLTSGPRATVTSVIDGDTVRLDSGTEVRLIGTQAPKLPLGRSDFETWPMADDAKAHLEQLALGKAVRLGYGGERIDRHGRALAHLFVTSAEGEVWAQQEMVAAGLARVYSFPDNRACLDLLLVSEGRARFAGLGIWTEPYYTVRRADRPAELLDRVGHYELVEGRVLNAERVGPRVFLNFGRLWKEDFTVTIESRALGLFEAERIDPLRLANSLVRVRGWVDDRDGPRIEVSHPEQIEILASP